MHDDAVKVILRFYFKTFLIIWVIIYYTIDICNKRAKQHYKDYK